MKKLSSIVVLCVITVSTAWYIFTETDPIGPPLETAKITSHRVPSSHIAGSGTPAQVKLSRQTILLQLQIIGILVTELDPQLKFLQSLSQREHEKKPRKRKAKLPS